MSFLNKTIMLTILAGVITSASDVHATAVKLPKISLSVYEERIKHNANGDLGLLKRMDSLVEIVPDSEKSRYIFLNKWNGERCITYTYVPPEDVKKLIAGNNEAEIEFAIAEHLSHRPHQATNWYLFPDHPERAELWRSRNYRKIQTIKTWWDTKDPDLMAHAKKCSMIYIDFVQPSKDGEKVACHEPDSLLVTLNIPLRSAIREAMPECFDYLADLEKRALREDPDYELRELVGSAFQHAITLAESSFEAWIKVKIILQMQTPQVVVMSSFPIEKRTRLEQYLKMDRKKVIDHFDELIQTLLTLPGIEKEALLIAASAIQQVLNQEVPELKLNIVGNIDTE